MTLEDRRRRALDVVPRRHVAELELAAELGSQRLEPLPPPRQQDALPAPPRQLPCRCLADPARRTGDDRDRQEAAPPARYLQTRAIRCASTLRPFASVTIARRVWRPFAAPPRFQTAE